MWQRERGTTDHGFVVIKIEEKGDTDHSLVQAGHTMTSSLSLLLQPAKQ